MEFLRDLTNKLTNSDYTNTLVTLLTLIILLVFYLIIFKFGAFIISYLMDWKGDPYIIRGRLDLPLNDNKFNQFFTNPMDSDKKDMCKVILRSKNESNGIEFTWGVWLYVHGRQMMETISTTDKTNYYHVFHKGSTHKGPTHEKYPFAVMSCPGLYLYYNPTNTTNDNIPDDDKVNGFGLTVTCNTMSNLNLMETIDIPTIPIDKWMYVVIRCVNHKLDVYINGKIKKRSVLEHLPRQNYGDIYIGEKLSTGSDATASTLQLHGQISNLRYFNYALQARTIEYFTEKGPTLGYVENKHNERKMNETLPYYLDQKWHYRDYLH